MQQLAKDQTQDNKTTKPTIYPSERTVSSRVCLYFKFASLIARHLSASIKKAFTFITKCFKPRATVMKNEIRKNKRALCPPLGNPAPIIA